MPDKLPDFSRPLVKWYREHQRDLPWRDDPSPYRVWLSEIILQQTRVDQGLPYYRRFVDHFPTVHELAGASPDKVLKLWQGLGYYSRARNLHHTAQTVSCEMDGRFPGSYRELLKLKGVGPYTASAIASICFGEAKAVVDGNVFRVLSRVFGMDQPVNSSRGRKAFEALAQELVDSQSPGTYNQALMEFGAIHCKPAKPLCGSCIFAHRCEALKTGKVQQLPVKKAKTKVRRRYFNYLVVLDEYSGARLEKRLEKDIWHHLYDFPLVESSSPLSEAELVQHPRYTDLCEQLDVRSVGRYNDLPVVHRLSHQELHLTFWVIQVAGRDEASVAIRDIGQYPVPVPIGNFISEFQPFQ